MTYNIATDSYQNDEFEQILDTNFRYDIPYKIDREKYAEILKKHNQKMRIVDADVVLFRTDYCCSSSFDYNDEEKENKEPYLYAFYAWPENSPEGRYDCFLFSDDEYENKELQKEAYENFIREIMGCIIEVDKEYLQKVKDELISKIEEFYKQLNLVNNILNEK